MKNSIFIILALALIFLEALFFYKLEIRGVRPDFLLVLIFFIAFNTPLEKAIIPVWLIGFFKDIVSQSGLGTTALLYLVSVLVISLLKEVIFKDDTGIQVVVLFLSVWLCHFLNGLGLFLFYFAGMPPLGYIMLKSLATSIYTVLVGGLLLIAVYKIQWHIRWRASQP
ncbi:MAG: rod shape-determining protein MreD [Planctomycetes bacterium]|nr:rod shape-determining protein MreD [Planctomycetota bacterium]